MRQLLEIVHKKSNHLFNTVLLKIMFARFTIPWLEYRPRRSQAFWTTSFPLDLKLHPHSRNNKQIIPRESCLNRYARVATHIRLSIFFDSDCYLDLSPFNPSGPQKTNWDGRSRVHSRGWLITSSKPAFLDDFVLKLVIQTLGEKAVT